jgi:hypothetical protein
LNSSLKLSRKKAKQTSFQVEASWDNNWLKVTLNIGTPSQPIPVMLDTGSYFLMVKGSACTVTLANTPPYKCAAPLFNELASTTFIKTEETQSMGYGSGQTNNGYIGSDTLMLGGATCKNCQVIVQTDAIGSVPVVGKSGTMGMAKKLSSI